MDKLLGVQVEELLATIHSFSSSIGSVGRPGAHWMVVPDVSEVFVQGARQHDVFPWRRLALTRCDPFDVGEGDVAADGDAGDPQVGCIPVDHALDNPLGNVANLDEYVPNEFGGDDSVIDLTIDRVRDGAAPADVRPGRRRRRVAS
jgi:hypothetical protein